MRRIVNLDTSQSIRRGKLICKTDFADISNKIPLYFYCALFTYGSAYALINADYSNPSIKSFVLLFAPLIFIASLYTLYRKATEKRLLKIITSFNLDQNKKVLRKFILGKGYKPSKRAEDYMIFNEMIEDAWNTRSKTVVFIVRDNLVFFTMLEEHRKINWPTFFTHLLFKRELKKIFNHHDIS